MIKKYLQFLNEQEVVIPGLPEKDPNELVKFQISQKFEKLLNPLKSDYKIAEFYLKLKDGVQRINLSKDPPNYLDVDNEGNLSYLKSRYWGEGDPWTSTRRIKMKITKALKDFYAETYINNYIKQTDVESFVNKWAIVAKPNAITAEEFRGVEVMRAYNYKKELTPNFGYSCANFHQAESEFGKYSETRVSEFDIYTKNPEQIGAVVAWENGRIMGRRSIQQGVQVCDSGSYKKGEFHTVWGNYYGVGGSGGKYDKVITDYIKSKWSNATKMQCSPDGRSAICISLETRFTYYCPFDSMYVNFEHNLMTDISRYLPAPYGNYEWVDTYHAFCPKELVRKRIKEENLNVPDVNVRILSDVVLPKLPWKRELTTEEFEEMCSHFPHYTWAPGIDSNGRLIMNERSTMPHRDQRGSYYLTEDDLSVLTGKEVPKSNEVQKEPYPSDLR
jgi:hypothetical protein